MHSIVAGRVNPTRRVFFEPISIWLHRPHEASSDEFRVKTTRTISVIRTTLLRNSGGHFLTAMKPYFLELGGLSERSIDQHYTF